MFSFGVFSSSTLSVSKQKIVFLKIVTRLYTQSWSDRNTTKNKNADILNLVFIIQGSVIYHQWKEDNWEILWKFLLILEQLMQKELWPGQMQVAFIPINFTPATNTI